jgi:predicted ATPase
MGQFSEAAALTNETIRMIEENGDFSYLPEVLRMQGRLFLSMPQPSERDAETSFMQSLELSRHQCALAWELRTAVDLAELLANQGHRDTSRALLGPLLEQYTEASGIPDVLAAENLLTRLG